MCLHTGYIYIYIHIHIYIYIYIMYVCVYIQANVNDKEYYFSRNLGLHVAYVKIFKT